MVLNDLENIEGTDAEIRCHWHEFLVDIFISCILNLRLILLSLPFSFFFLVFTYGCPCEVHTRSVAKRYRCGHWLWSKDLLIFIDYKKYRVRDFGIFLFFFFSMEVEFCSRAQALLMPTYNITFTIPGGYMGERACSIRVNWTRLIQTDKVNVNSFGIYVSEYRKVSQDYREQFQTHIFVNVTSVVIFFTILRKNRKLFKFSKILYSGDKYLKPILFWRYLHCTVDIPNPVTILLENNRCFNFSLTQLCMVN